MRPAPSGSSRNSASTSEAYISCQRLAAVRRGGGLAETWAAVSTSLHRRSMHCWSPTCLFPGSDDWQRTPTSGEPPKAESSETDTPDALHGPCGAKSQNWNQYAMVTNNRLALRSSSQVPLKQQRKHVGLRTWSQAAVPNTQARGAEWNQRSTANL